ncbi:unnamed protein product [Strongylus vulgaris]|uniref:Uncharacterized protein n=1 Tax=Strongylus vulgaris TaxID=40348 RepID=A0A3P7K620_STRVU|nr:unnamed protein product [Strongylus vulgaris]
MAHAWPRPPQRMRPYKALARTGIAGARWSENGVNKHEMAMFGRYPSVCVCGEISDGPLPGLEFFLVLD